MEEKKIGELIKERREELGYSQVKLASLLGVNSGTVSRWDSGKTQDMRLDNLDSLSIILKFPITEMFSLSAISLPDNSKLGELIRTQREKLSITQNQLAGLIGINHSTISRWERGLTKDIKRAQICLLSKYLYIPIDTILGLSNETSTEDLEVVKKRISIQSKLENINDKSKLENIEKIIDALM